MSETRTNASYSAREPLAYVGGEVGKPVERCGTEITLSRYVDGVLSRHAVRAMCGGLAYDIESERVAWYGGAYRGVTFDARGVRYGNALDKCPCCKQPFWAVERSER